MDFHHPQAECPAIKQCASKSISTLYTKTYVILVLHTFSTIGKYPVALLLIGPTGVASGEARPPGDNGYHFVFMPSHLFPAYPSYRWGAIVADRYEDSACLQPNAMPYVSVAFPSGA